MVKRIKIVWVTAIELEKIEAEWREHRAECKDEDWSVERDGNVFSVTTADEIRLDYVLKEE